MARVAEGRAENARLMASLERDRQDEALLRQDTAAQQAYTDALLAGDACARMPFISPVEWRCLPGFLSCLPPRRCRAPGEPVLCWNGLM